ncbi:MAG: aminodeoxychorismate lyase [Neptuniibacter sp.]
MQKVWVNGVQQDQVSVTDRAFTYGDGLFETIRVSASHPELLENHLTRLKEGLKRLKFAEDTNALILEDIQSIKFAGDQILKVIVSRGEGARGYALPMNQAATRVILLSDRTNYAEQPSEGVSVRICQYQMAINPVLAGLKHLNRLEQVLARSEWQGEFAEGVVTDRDGFVVEGTMSNLFWVNDGVIYTPKLDRCGVQGVMRNFVIQQLMNQGDRVQEGYYPVNALIDADEIFLTNSLIHIWPVKELDSKLLKVGPVTRKIQTLLQQESSL